MILFTGILFTILYIAFVAVIGGELAWYIDAASLVFVLAPLAYFLLITKNGKSICCYVKSSFTKNYAYVKGELDSIAGAAKNAMKVTLAAGGVSFLIGLMIILRRLDDPQTLGVYFSVMLVSLLYSLGISFFVFFPLQAWAENKIKALF